MGEPVTLILNGAKVILHKNNLAFVLIDILCRLENEFSSADALRENLDQALELFEEFKPSLKKKRRILEKIKTRENLVKFYFETILSLSNLATLPGFSCICGAEHGRSNYNPEKYRMTKTLEEREL